MNKTPIAVDADFFISQIDRRVFASFIEHRGRCVYIGILNPVTK
jgi:alpha-L-arabinofuranosidase